jgi:Ca2+-binding EF-hand superfamily protein
MTEPVLIVRGPFPFGGPDADPESLVQSDGFLRDARILIKTDEDRFQGALKVFDAYDGFLDMEALRKLLTEPLGDADSAASVARFIHHFDRVRKRFKVDPEEYLSALNEALARQEGTREDNRKPLSAEERSKLNDRLKQLLKPNRSLTRQAKAEELASVLGSRLEDVQLICDLRPIFDPERKVVEGMIPLTTLKLVVTGPSGLPVTMEAWLTHEQVESLTRKCDLAKRKLEALGTFLEKNKIPRPKTE